MAAYCGTCSRFASFPGEAVGDTCPTCETKVEAVALEWVTRSVREARKR